MNWRKTFREYSESFDRELVYIVQTNEEIRKHDSFI